MRKSTRRVSDYPILFVVNDNNTAREFRTYFESRYHFESEEAFYEILTAVRGDASLDICSKKHPFVVVIDVDLPDINGYELAKRMRERQVDLPLFCIFLVENDRLVDNVRFPELDGEYYVTKPFAMEDVEQCIRTIRARLFINFCRDSWTRLPSDRAIEDELKSPSRSAGLGIAVYRRRQYEYIERCLVRFIGA